MPKATQFTICLENKPGQGGKVGAALQRAGVNVLAFCVVDGTDVQLIRMVPENSTKARQALTKAGLAPTRQSVLSLALPNQPGALGEVAAKLAAAGININYAYGSVAAGASEGMVVLGVSDLEQALAVL